MNTLRLAVCFFAVAVTAVASDGFFDRLEDRLTFSTAEGQVRARLSGTLELEGYAFQLPAPGVIQSKGAELFAPRLSVFLDAQLGTRLYAFAQARVDRGFDPTAARLEARLDEYALRFTPWKSGQLNIQAGTFATVVGNWATRHGGWSNPFITAPVPYEYLTGMWDTEIVHSTGELLQWSHLRPGLTPTELATEKSLRIPIVWGPSYAPGVLVAGDFGRFRYSAEAKLGSLSSRPEAWRHGREQRHHPTASVRLGYRPNQMWNLGVSASEGSYLREDAGVAVPAGLGRGAYRQQVLAHDLAFAWHHLQVWAEVFASRFAIPGVGNADTLAYYVETKYKFTPRFFGALRWNQQLFDTVPERGTELKWGHDIWRVDLAPGYRFTPHTQLKFQYSWQRGDSGPRDYTRTLAAQFAVRF